MLIFVASAGGVAVGGLRLTQWDACKLSCRNYLYQNSSYK